MTAYKVTPPCLPFDPHHHHPHHKDQQDRLEDKVQAAPIIKPTSAVIELEYEFIFIIYYNTRFKR